MSDADEAGWRVVAEGYDPAREPHRQTLFALADGLIGVRAGLEEAPSPTDGAFAAGGFETTPIHYHERHPGFAAATDTRLPVADGARIAILLDGRPVDFTKATCTALTRELDVATGRYSRLARWRIEGGELEVRAQRVMAGDPAGTLAIRFEVTSVDITANLTLVSSLDADHRAAPPGDDPRVGAAVPDGWSTETRAFGVVQSSRRSRRWVACAQRHRSGEGLTALGGDRYSADLTPGRSVRLDKTVAYAQGGGGIDEAALAALAETARTASEAGFEALAEARARQLRAFWAAADVRIQGDPAAQLALRLNLFHCRQSASQDAVFGTAAKGLTGEGYEGHVFWDSEAFLVPLLVFTAPDLARAALSQRFSQLDAARRNARVLNHADGVLFAWRTIAGAECSAHYPTGSAQYHVNAAVAQAIQLYMAATDDREFLLSQGAEMLVEMARLWMSLGVFSPRHGGAFCIFGVTGPDEYTALVDNNFYTNRMAALHLAYAADVAGELAGEEVIARLAVTPEETARWRAAAAAVRLPHDGKLGIDAQDDSFLDKPRWPAQQAESADGRHAPLLLGSHPMTLYRHQIAKQADLVLAMVFAGDDVDPDLKRRNFDYYEGVTTHDSTLSNCPFAILAARVGELDKAGDYFRRNVLVDLDDRHGNTSHGMHMAALAGSWMAATYGFAGLAWRSGTLAFAPALPPGWEGLAFQLRWQGRRLDVEIGPSATRYRLTEGAALDIRHDGAPVSVPAGGGWIECEAGGRRSAA